MAIQNVESTLPDRAYVAALERELRELRAMVEQNTLDILAVRA